MEMWIIWLIVAAVLMIVEVLSQMIWTLCVAIACLAAMIMALLGLNLGWQLIVLAVVSVVVFIVGVPAYRRIHDNMVKKENKNDRTGMEALLGRRAVVTDAIHPGRLGRARIDGDYWQVTVPHLDKVIEPGREVVVTAYDSIILTVKPLNDK